jgi:hypothetical protein
MFAIVITLNCAAMLGTATHKRSGRLVRVGNGNRRFKRDSADFRPCHRERRESAHVVR